MGNEQHGWRQLASFDLAVPHAGLSMVRFEPAGTPPYEPADPCGHTILVFLVLEGMTGPWAKFFCGRDVWIASHARGIGAWVSERKDVLSALFWMLTLWRMRATRKDGRGSKVGSRVPEAAVCPRPSSFDLQLLLALLFFALGLMSKPMLVTLPFVLLLLDFWPLNRFPINSPMKLVAEKAPFFLLSVAVCIVTIPAQKGAGGVRTMANFPLMVRMENVPVSYCRYLGKLFWPANLPFFYPHPGHWPPVAVWGATLLLSGIFICAWMMRRDQPCFLVGWCWFVGTLVPVIGLVQVGFQSMANRYTYVPFIGIFLALSWGVPALTKHWRHQFLSYSPWRQRPS